MFDQLVKRSNAVWIYSTGRFAEERRIFLEEMIARGYGLRALRIINPILLAVAERVNIRRSGSITETQIVRAAENWVEKRSVASSTSETRNTATKRFIYVAKNWFRFNTIRAWLGHVSVDTTNIYAETDLAMKAKALAACDPGGGHRRKKRWRYDPNLMEFLRKL